MKSLFINKTKATPEINFNYEKNYLQIVGESYPENARIFFKDSLAWISEYLEDKNRNIVFDLKITYLNTSSSKIVTEILEFLQDYHNSNGKILLNWFYEEDDEDSKDNGEIFLEDHTFPYELIPFLDE
ncbi:MAG: DUF1987 domain-containing protein [Candidatus Cloacimonetes bacterium]|nr:DUF1987 domain-containing protein [Candidatus Cloacimonadota bacterium]